MKKLRAGMVRSDGKYMTAITKEAGVLNINKGFLTIDQISPNMINALVSEDKRFYDTMDSSDKGCFVRHLAC